MSPRARLLVCALVCAPGCTLLVPGEPTNVLCTEEGAVGPPVCPSGTFCHGGACLEGPPVLGEPCAPDGMCAPGDQCFDPATAGLAGQEICSRSCCSSGDCGVGTGLVCAGPGPGKMCLPAEIWGRGELGTRFAGEPCEADSECRSGLCSTEQYCADTCCSDAECGLFAGTCRDDGEGWTCQPTGTQERAPFLEPCEDPAECESGLCVMWSDGAARCATPCCSSDECGEAKIGGSIARILCVPILHDAAVVHACAGVSTGDAHLAVGEPCEDPGQCRGGRCIEAGSFGAKVCSDVCCTDASCGAPHLFACAPVPDSGLPQPGTAGQTFELQCVPR